MGRVQVSKWTQYRSEGGKKQKKNRNEENLLGFKNVKITKKKWRRQQKNWFAENSHGGLWSAYDRTNTVKPFNRKKIPSKNIKALSMERKRVKKKMRPWSHSVYQPREINVENRKPQIFCYSKTHHQANCLFELLKRSGGAGQWRQIMGSNKPPFNDAKL